MARNHLTLQQKFFKKDEYGNGYIFPYFKDRGKHFFESKIKKRFPVRPSKFDDTERFFKGKSIIDYLNKYALRSPFGNTSTFYRVEREVMKGKMPK